MKCEIIKLAKWKLIFFVCDRSSLDDTGRWGDNGGEGPVIQRVVEDPGEEDTSGETPAGGVAQLVGLSLLGQFPESGQVHL